MSRKARWIIDVIILVVWLLADNPDATGISLHEWLSVGLGLAAAVHLALNWDWVLHAARRILGKLRSASRLNFIVDVVLFLSFVAVMQSGIVISQVLLPLVGLKAVPGEFWTELHSASAQMSIVALAVHFALHWRWIASTARMLFAPGPPAGGSISTVSAATNDETQEEAR
jgi:hypothetical protein